MLYIRKGEIFQLNDLMQIYQLARSYSRKLNHPRTTAASTVTENSLAAEFISL